MRTWTATTTVEAPPEAVLDVLTDPGACARWAPVDFEVSKLEAKRLAPGCRPRVSGRIAGVEVGFDVEVLEAGEARLQLRCDGPVAIDVRYDLEPAERGSEVKASVGVKPGRGIRSRILAEATSALLRAGALNHALDRIGRECVAV
jgi:Polyketide cyclase / dehydrase and lipid transport